jgi:hypothetical protein
MGVGGGCGRRSKARRGIGAVPYEVDPTPQDLYKEIDFPNYHYVKLTIAAGVLTGEMYRLEEATAELSLRPERPLRPECLPPSSK